MTNKRIWRKFFQRHTYHGIFYRTYKGYYKHRFDFFKDYSIFEPPSEELKAMIDSAKESYYKNK